jgi:hypothetical protein
VALQAGGEGAEAAQGEVAVVGGGGAGDLHDAGADALEHLGGGGDGTHHQVGVAADVLRDRLDRDVDAERERLEVERRGPGVVEEDQRARGVRDLGDRRDVLDLEGERARALAEDQAGVRANSSRRPAPPSRGS